MSAQGINDLVVNLGERSYPVLFRRDAVEELTARARALCVTGRAIVISDETVGGLYAAAWADALRTGGLEVIFLTFPDGEAHKTIKTVERIYAACLDAGVDRQTPVFAFGGGVVGDVGGFVAATLLRGLPFVQIPTTVLSQVDSSVGGKTGVNVGSLKNMVGAFYQPKWVFSDVAWLSSLTLPEVRSGLGEVVKHGALGDLDLLNTLRARGPALAGGDLDALAEVIPAAVAVKAAVVEQDEREGGLRRILNLGHTLGHAIEATVPGQVRHGEAVALGMGFAAELSRARGWLDSESVGYLDETLRFCGLSTDWRRWLRPKILEKVAKDKKVRGECIDVVMLRGLGAACSVRLPCAAFIEEGLRMSQTESSNGGGGDVRE